MDAQGTSLYLDTPRWAWGLRRIVRLPNPAAGAEWSFTAGESNLLMLITAIWKLKTSAQVANRVPAIAIRDGDANTLGIVSSAQQVAAGATQVVSAVLRGPFDTTGASGITPIGFPPLILPVGYSLAGNTQNLQTEDQEEGVTLWVNEFEQNPEHPLAEVRELIRHLRLAEVAVYGATG